MGRAEMPEIVAEQGFQDARGDGFPIARTILSYQPARTAAPLPFNQFGPDLLWV